SSSESVSFLARSRFVLCAAIYWLCISWLGGFSNWARGSALDAGWARVGGGAFVGGGLAAGRVYRSQHLERRARDGDGSVRGLCCRVLRNRAGGAPPLGLAGSVRRPKFSGQEERDRACPGCPTAAGWAPFLSI